MDRRGVFEIRERCQHLSFYITIFSSKKGAPGLIVGMVIGLIRFEGVFAREILPFGIHLCPLEKVRRPKLKSEAGGGAKIIQGSETGRFSC